MFWRLIIRLTLFLFILAACGTQEPGVPVTGETAVMNLTSTPASPGLPPEAVLNAQDWLATRLNIPTAQVQITDVEQAEWSDSCLGLGRLNESCAAVVTPGWRVIFNVNNQRYEVRTDETGASIRPASPEETPSTSVNLENSHWRLISFGPPETNTPLIEKSLITLIFMDGQVAGMGGCNSYGGTYQVEGSRISFNEITRTKKACENEYLTLQEEHYFLALESAGRYELSENLLRLWFEDGAGLLVFQTPSPIELTPAIQTPGG